MAGRYGVTFVHETYKSIFSLSSWLLLLKHELPVTSLPDQTCCYTINSVLPRNFIFEKKSQSTQYIIAMTFIQKFKFPRHPYSFVDEGSVLLERNVVFFSPVNCVTFKDKGCRFLRNVESQTPNNTASHQRGPKPCLEIACESEDIVLVPYFTCHFCK